MKTADMQAHLIGWTTVDKTLMRATTGDVWEPDSGAGGGELLAEFAGRACYESWAKPNPATASNAGYLRHILEVGHGSVLEHGTASFYVTGVSRSLTHELIRHRHFSYSQLSQRFVDSTDTPVVVPDVIAADPDTLAAFRDAVETAQRAYATLAAALEQRMTYGAVGRHRRSAYLPDDSPNPERCEDCGVSWPCTPVRTAARKRAREAARAVLPNATETRIAVTGNYRAWRHFIDLRATEHADVEIRALAVECLKQLQWRAASVFGDYAITALDDGTEVATSMLGALTP